MTATTKTVSVLKELGAGEKRVVLLPAEVAGFAQAGFDVFVERGAGERAGASDDDYRASGAALVTTDEAWEASRYVLKYKAPRPEEFRHFREGLVLGASFHAEGDATLTGELCRRRVTAYSFEFFCTTDGIFPLSAPSSEISGKLAVLFGAYHLQSHLGGRGILLADVPGVERPRILVIGHGNAGGAAARLAQAMGAEVVVLGSNRERLRRFQATVPSTVECHLNSPEVLEREVPRSDLVIGAILVSSYDTEPMVGEHLVRLMKPGSMIVDVTCGYGSGYLPTFDRQTSHDDPVYERFGVLHCKIDALPSSVPVTVARATSTVRAPYLIALGRAIFEGFDDPMSEAGKITEGGRVVHSEVARHMDMFAAEIPNGR